MLPLHAAATASHIACAGHYRELALDTLSRSETARSEDARMHYLLLAAHWYERALECERDPDGENT